MLQSQLQSETIVRQLQVLEKTILAPVAQLLPVAKDFGDGITNPGAESRA
jgi:hypothetical protein